MLDAEYSWMEPSETSANITSFSNEESLVFSAAKAGMVNAKTQESVFGELSGGGGAEVPALAIPRGSAQKHFHTDAPTGRRCESAFALLSHKKVTKRLWTAASYGKIGVVGYRLLQERDG